MTEGPVVPGDVESAARLASQLRRLAATLRAVAAAEVAQLRALSGWAGRAHRAWVGSAERVASGCVGVASTLDEVARLLDYFRRSVLELRERAAGLAARARVAHLDVTADASVRPVGMLVPCTALTSAGLTGGRTAVPPTTAPSWQTEVAGRHLAAAGDPWRALQLDIAALLDDARTVYAATLAGLRSIADGYDRARVAPTGPARPDGGGHAIAPVGAAALLAQLPAAREELAALRDGPDPEQLAGLLARRPATLPDTVAGVVRARALGRAARMTVAARALDRVVAAADRVPVVPAVASYPVGRLAPIGRPGGVLQRVPVVDVLLAGYAVADDVTDRRYSLPAAVGREGAGAATSFGAAQATGYVLVALGGPPAAAAIVALGIGLLVGDLVTRAYDRGTGHG